MTMKIITQLSIFVNNEPGRLAAIAGILKDNKVNMKVCNLAESTEFGILRALVDEPEESYNRIKDKGIIVKKTDMIGIRMNDDPGSIFQSADVLGKAEINIEYGYTYTDAIGAILFVRVDNPQNAIVALENAGITLVSSSEI